jgi:hypothetical protein
LLSDLYAASRDTLETASALEQACGALLHVGLVGPGVGTEPELARADEPPWAELATRRGGVVWYASAGDEEDYTAAERRHALFEHWARPVRLEQLALDAVPAPPFLALADRALDEGEELLVQGFASEAFGTLRLKAKLWAAEIELQTTPDAAAGDRLAALVFGDELRDELSEDEMMVLALRGKAVSPVTSYLAIEPGVRPSTEGLSAEEVGMVGFGSGGWRGRGHAVPRIRTSSFDAQAFLERELRERLQVCGGEDLDGHVRLETTLDELADIAELRLQPPPPADVEACMRAATWMLSLPGEFDAPHATWVVAL